MACETHSSRPPDIFMMTVRTGPRAGHGNQALVAWLLPMRARHGPDAPV
jgi:hypothetical protein